MNEYNFEVEEIRDENSQKTETPSAPVRTKKHIALKIAASLMAMVMVSAGSIAVYRQFDGREISETSSVSEVSADEQAVKAENVGFINTVEKKSGELSTEDVIEKALPSVVGIESKFTFTSQFNGFDGFFGSYFGGNAAPQTKTVSATGTGIIITENGYIVTNAHVIYDSENGWGLSEETSVILSDEKTYDAEIVSYDTECDLAVLKINAEGLTAAEFGDSDSLRLGESVVAIGNPLGFELMDTATRGIISGKNRSITINDQQMTLIQTDAPINSGNSGGPLLNKYGQVIGINSSKMSSAYSATTIEGIGFAIPSNEAAKIIDDLMKYGYVTGKPQIGISYQDVTESISKMYGMPMGVYVVSVTEGSAAEAAGLRKGDIITAVDGVEITTSEELKEQKDLHSAGEEIELTFVRNGEEMKTKVRLDEVKQEKVNS